MGAGDPQASHPRDAPGRPAAAERGAVRGGRRPSRDGDRRRGGGRPEPGPAPRRPPPEPRRVRQRHSRSPRPRRRHPGPAAGRRLGLRLRQHRRRAVGVAHADRALPVGGAQDQPARGGRPEPRPVDRDLHRRQVPEAGRPGQRRPAVRLAGRVGGAAHVPRGRRVRRQDLLGPHLRRPAARPRQPARDGGAARRRPRGDAHRGRPRPRRVGGRAAARLPQLGRRRAGGALHGPRRPPPARGDLRRPGGGARGHAPAPLRGHELRVRGRPEPRSGHRPHRAAGALRRHRPRRHAEPPRHLRVPASGRRGAVRPRRGRVRPRDPGGPRAPRVPPAARRRRPRHAARLLPPRGARAATSTRASRWPCAGCS